uniref:Uncharacterized protein n=1 Tax=Anguilla anguilla TaxID=7936 RepID=A0A0E9TDD2_ANGAN
MHTMNCSRKFLTYGFNKY